MVLFYIEVIRTRDPLALAEADIVVDVGAIYDLSRNLFDHHQRDFQETFSPKHNVTKLSSAGLIYKHFGKLILKDYSAQSCVFLPEMDLGFLEALTHGNSRVHPGVGEHFDFWRRVS